MTAIFNWRDIWMGKEEWIFLYEVIIRTSIMFLAIIIGLRVLGKRGIKQLSIFELVVIIGLGSAAGDPMMNKDVGIVPSLLIFLVIIGLYRGIIFIIGRNRKFENLVEGQSLCLIKEGYFSIKNFQKEALGSYELFSELRLKGISQLGQVKTAIEEISGEISVFYYPDEEVKYGLSIMPGCFDTSITFIEKQGHYSCINCGFTEIKQSGAAGNCIKCDCNQWTVSSNEKRIT